jgi:glycosyltransferase involved in cell wall biosynthesis
VGYSVRDLEILVATMHRTDLSFLEDMFTLPLTDLPCRVLVVNQTKGSPLISPFEHVKVINMSSFGLSKSRNTALENASGPLCLIADDDIRYKNGFLDDVIPSINSTKGVAMHGFTLRMEPGGKYHRNYKILNQLLRKEELLGINSIEMLFNLNEVRKTAVRFNEFFGLGSALPVGEEYIFARELMAKGLTYYQHETVLGYHPEESTGKHQSDPQIIAANAAIRFHLYGSIAYLWTVKYALFLNRQGLISVKEIPKAVKQALAGIRHYRQLAAS